MTTNELKAAVLAALSEKLSTAESVAFRLDLTTRTGVRSVSAALAELRQERRVGFRVIGGTTELAYFI